MKGKTLFSIVGILSLSFGLFACHTDPSTQTSSIDSTPMPTSPTSKGDDNLTEGPATTDVPNDTATIRTDDPIYDDEPEEVDPVWPAEVQTEPGQYNVYYATERTNVQRDMLWLWGGPTSGCAIDFTTTTATVSGIDGLTFSAFYLNFNVTYYCYTGWTSSASGVTGVKITKTSCFTRCKVKSTNGSSSNPDNIDLPTPSGEQTNIYIFEKTDGEAKAFTDVSAFLDFKNNVTPAVDVSTTTSPSDYNIYFYSAKTPTLNYVYSWEKCTFLLSATTTVTAGAYTFNAIYIQYSVKYNVGKDWDNTAGVQTFTSSTYFEKGLLRDAAGTQATKTDNIITALTPDPTTGKFDIYIMEKASGDVDTFTTQAEAIAFLDGTGA